VKVVADRWLHSVTEVPISFKHLILPEKFLPCTELLDLRSIPVAGLSADQQLFFSNFKTLNPIQTQLFFHLNDSKDNLLVLAPSRAGKTACAELSLLQFLITSSNDDRCLVLCPHKVFFFLIEDFDFLFLINFCM
jgi:pre-mRNA-splicing helicase BRR2